MLAPIIREDRLDGWISVHESRRARRWSDTEVAALEAAAEDVLRLLAVARDWRSARG